MKTTLITNTGPLIALAGAGHLELIKHFWSRVLVPEAVDMEIRRGQKGLGLNAYLQADWIEVKDPGLIDPLLLTEIDSGEAAVISLALKEQADKVLIDERKARKIARLVYNQNVIGTVRVLIQSKQEGLIPSIKEVINQMRTNGYWIHEAIIEYALQMANER